MVQPSGEGAVRCMQMALAGIDEPVDYINTHGTSTPVGDLKELEAIRQVFGGRNPVPAISSTKSLTGHSLGATGVQEAIRSEEHTSELQSLMRISYAVFCLKKKKNKLYKA